MGLFEGFSTRAEERFERELGAQPSVAALAALALHPFTATSPRPTNRQLTKIVRSGSSDFARAVRDVRNADELLALAREAVQPWHWAARHYGDNHYALVFCDALGSVPHDGRASTIFGSNPYSGPGGW